MGKIINISSDMQIPKGAQDVIQSWTDRGAIAHTEELADEVAEYGINVNGICINSLQQCFHEAREQPREINTQATQSAHDPAGIAEITLLFAGDASNGISGQTLHLNCA